MALYENAKLLIDGELVEATGGGRFDNINPATEEVVGVAHRFTHRPTACTRCIGKLCA